jgi:hypothetical protein
VQTATDNTTTNPTGNARLTGLAGAVLFVLLAAEGVTIFRVNSHLSLHMFLGMVLVPVVVLKIASTGYRFTRYYTGDPGYVAKGAPPWLLRVAGPFVVILTIAVFATGIALGIEGPGHDQILLLHKVSFVLWFAAMAVHVLGHLLETPRLAVEDWTGTSPMAPGRAARTLLIVGALLVGLVLAFATRSWTTNWQHHLTFKL